MRLFFLIFIFFIAGCSTITPVYVAKTNPYYYEPRELINNNLIDSQLIHTYTTDELESRYANHFCSNLHDCSYNINNIKNHPDFAYFDLDKNPIINNSTQTKTITLTRLLYTTQGQFNESRTVSGAVFIPDTPNIKGILLFYHPTYFNKDSVPSYAPNYGVDRALAAIFASNGYIVLAPDYIGMGYDRQTFHPYVIYPQVNVFDGVSMLNAFKNYSEENNLHVESDIPLFISGYSEGASYALWFSRLYQEQDAFKQQVDKIGFKPKMILPISGAYNLSSVTYSYLFSDINILTKNQFNISSSYLSGIIKPALLSYTLSAYTYYDLNRDYAQVYNPVFFNMGYSDISNSDYNKQTILNLETIFATRQYKDRQIVDLINNASQDELNLSPLAFNQWNNLSPLVQESILNNPEFMRFIHHGDIYYWHSTLPTSLIYLQHDSVVSSLNSIYAYQGMMANNSNNLNIIAMDNSLIHENMGSYIPDLEVDHINGFYYLFLIALTQMNTFNTGYTN